MRERILLAFLDLVSEQGLEAATYRDVAKRARTSTGAVQHHFPEKSLLIREGLIFAHERVGDDFAHTPERGEYSGPIGRLKRRSLRGLPLSDYSRGMAPFYLHYWAYASQDEPTRQIHHDRWEALTLEIEDIIARAFAEVGGLEPQEIQDLATCVISLKFGLGVHAALNPERCTPATIRRIMERFIDDAIEAQRARRDSIANPHQLAASGLE